MSNKSDLLKSIIKGQVTESPALDRFLKSRGLNPKTVTKDQKVAHSKLGQFKKWQRDHATDLTTMGEEVDKKDMVCFDIPLLIRVLEFTREDMSSDIELHNLVERLINMRHDVPLDMSHYDEITQKLVKENHIAIAMGKMLDDEGSMILNQLDDIERNAKMIRDYIGKDYEKQMPAWVQAKVTLASDYINTVGAYLSTKNEDVKEAHDPWQDKHFGPTKVIKQKYHVKTDTKSYNVKADNEEHAHKLVTKHSPGSKIVSIEHKGRMMEEVEINELNKSTLASYAKKATDDATYHSFSAGTRSAKDPQRLKDDEKAMKRQSGVNKAIDRLSKEEVEQADESYNGPRGDKLIAVSHAAHSAGDKEKSKRAHTLAMKAGEKYRSNPENRDKAISHIMSGANKDYTSGKTRTNDSVEVDGDVIEEKSIDPNSSFLNKVGSFIHGSKTKTKPKTSLSTMRDAFKSDAKKTSHQSSSSGGNISYRLVRAEEVVAEGSAALRLAQALRKEREARELKDKSREAAEKNEKARQQPTQQQEAALEDPQSATQAPYDCANNPDDTVPKGKKLIQMSKSARIIKSIYKRKGMKEEIYDTEKEGKSIATYGKKPKLSDNEKKIEAVGGKPQAAAIMTGGTTLTGTPRDTVEIDPMMKPPKPGSLGQSDKPKNNNR